jgi:Uma2 family endonuclease
MTAIPQLQEERVYTVEDLNNLPEDVRAELIDGQIYCFAAPSPQHQEMITELVTAINNHFKSEGSPCKIYPAPFAVFLNEDDKTEVQPDISIVCDPSKIDNKGCNGAPDWIIEIISPTNASHDYVRKLKKYMAAGVKEYWIVDRDVSNVTVYTFDPAASIRFYTLSDSVPVGIFGGFSINFGQLNI